MIRTGIRFGALAAVVVLSMPGAALAQSQDRYASYVVDMETGRVLHARNADELRYPASLTKMMTLYVLFDALEAGEIGLNDRMAVSERAAEQEPSKIYVRAGSTLRVEDAILALTTKSANDAAVVIAERLGGSVEQFARMMTEKARELGMTRTRFRNPNGLPDEAQVTTAHDLALLGEALYRNHPTYYSYFSASEFRYGNVTYRNHNHLLEGMDGVTGVDGIKTGYIRASGYNLVTSAEREDHRIVAVVLGGSTSRVRDAHMADLVEQAFVAMEENPEAPILVATMSPEGGPLSYVRGMAFSDPETELANTMAREQTVSFASLALDAPAPQAVSQIVSQGDGGSGVTADRGVRIVFSEDAGRPAPEERGDVALSAIQPVVLRMPAEPDQDRDNHHEPVLRTVLRETDDVIGGGWEIQVGAYRDPETAQSRIAQLEAMAINVLSGAASRIENATVDDARWYRARFAGLTEDAARAACSALTRAGDGCFPVAPGS